jgi:hypothetical protein
MSLFFRVALVVVATMTLTACAYDYLQHSDRIAYSAGDAVRANLERETADPSHGAMYDLDGLGANGAVIATETSP